MKKSTQTVIDPVEITPGKRVLLFAEFGTTGGTRTYFLQLLDFYKELGFSVDVVSFFQPGADIEKKCIEAGFSITHFHSYETTYQSFATFPFFLRKEARFFKSFVQRIGPNIIVSSVGTPGLFLGVQKLAPKGIYILHTYPTTKRKSIGRWLRARIIRLFVPAETFYVSVSDFSRTALKNVWGLSERKHRLEVVPNALGPPLESAQKVSGRPNVLTVAHVIDYKNPLTWIQVAKRVCEVVPDATFTWLGAGPDIDLCREIVSKSGLQDRILFTGDANNVAPFYDDAHVYVQLSRIENSPFAVLEAFRRGIPCVLTNLGGLRELAQGGDSAVLVSPDSPDEIVAAIVSLLESEELRETYRQGSLRHYRNNHRYEDWLSQLGDLHGVNEPRSATSLKDLTFRQEPNPIDRNRPQQHRPERQ